MPEAKLWLLVVKEPLSTPQWLLLIAEPPPGFQPPNGSPFPPLHHILNCGLASRPFPFHRPSMPLFRGTTTSSQCQPDKVRGFHFVCVFISTLLKLLPLWVFFQDLYLSGLQLLHTCGRAVHFPMQCLYLIYFFSKMGRGSSMCYSRGHFYRDNGI